jgi:hypothetical protein
MVEVISPVYAPQGWWDGLYCNLMERAMEPGASFLIQGSPAANIGRYRVFRRLVVVEVVTRAVESRGCSTWKVKVDDEWLETVWLLCGACGGSMP